MLHQKVNEQSAAICTLALAVLVALLLASLFLVYCCCNNGRKGYHNRHRCAASEGSGANGGVHKTFAF